MYLAALFVLTVFAAQLVRVQAFDASRVQEAALAKRLTTEVLLPTRGRILDSKGNVLAASVERRTVTVNQTAVKAFRQYVDGRLVTTGVVGAAQALAPLLHTTPDALVPQLMGTSGYRILAKGVTPLEWRQIEALGIPGVLSEVTFSREYPAGQSAASLVGFVTDDQSAGGGLEWAFDADLAGTQGKDVFEQARDGKAIPWGQQDSTPAVDGKDVQLTIDADLQWYATNALAQQVERMGAKSGYLVVEEVKTGKLRAVASYPTFDPTKVRQASPGDLGNRAFQEVYEPGSTAKVMSIAAAIEQGQISPTTPVIVPNRLKRSDKTLKDSHDHDTLNLTVAGVLAKSSNIGTILSTEGVPASTMDQYFRAFGLGAKSGIGFPGESAGLLTPAAELNGSQRYTMLFGQGIAVTAIQATGVFQTIANGGVRLTPSLVEGVTAPGGEQATPAPTAGTRVVSTSTATQVSQMLEEVTLPGGTAPMVAMPGYRVAGKTGTANRIEEGRGYAGGGYTVSFVGYAPAEDPKFVISVVVQRPALSNPAGGAICGPVFKDVMTYALQSYQVPPTGQAPVSIPLTTGPLSPGAPGVIYDRKSTG
jgi:cell division protein FtsI (penicillin-binding protein 3)